MLYRYESGGDVRPLIARGSLSLELTAQTELPPNVGDIVSGLHQKSANWACPAVQWFYFIHPLPAKAIVPILSTGT